jgi:hypothetical protein
MSTRPEEYVLPANETIADIIAHIQNCTGPILIHSEPSGFGKTNPRESAISGAKRQS